MVVHRALASLAARWEPVSRLLEGGPIVLALGGVLRRDVALRHAVSAADLAEALRRCGMESVEGARSVTLEPSGRITVVKGS